MSEGRREGGSGRMTKRRVISRAMGESCGFLKGVEVCLCVCVCGWCWEGLGKERRGVKYGVVVLQGETTGDPPAIF